MSGIKEKNDGLRIERGVSFEDVLIIINENKLLDTIDHPNEKSIRIKECLLLRLIIMFT